MNPGRELDALVAEKVMGWRREQFVDVNGDVYQWRNSENLAADIPEYSTDIAAAWAVGEKCGLNSVIDLKKQGWFAVAGLDMHTQRLAFYTKEFEMSDGAFGETAPHSICLAALKAVGHEI